MMKRFAANDRRNVTSCRSSTATGEDFAAKKATRVPLYRPFAAKIEAGERSSLNFATFGPSFTAKSLALPVSYVPNAATSVAYAANDMVLAAISVSDAAYVM